MSVDMLRMTGNSVVADELELSTLNSGLGMMSPSGRWVTYNTPMSGVRKSSSIDTSSADAFPGAWELNCCAVNGPRALGMIGDWALMRDEAGIVLNYYGPCQMTARLGTNQIALRQTTSYPRTGKIELHVRPRRPASFRLRLRIPYWSALTRVSVNGRSAGKVEPGRYLSIDRKWKAGDVVRITLDMSLHFWAGARECKGKTAVYRGPILLTYDPRFNEESPDGPPQLDARTMKGRVVRSRSWLQPWVLCEYAGAEGAKVRLCDYASAGAAGDPYQSWLPLRNAPKAPFSRQNPLRSSRP